MSKLFDLVIKYKPCPNEKCLAIKHYQSLFGDPLMCTFGNFARSRLTVFYKI